MPVIESSSSRAHSRIGDVAPVAHKHEPGLASAARDGDVILIQRPLVG